MNSPLMNRVKQRGQPKPPAPKPDKPKAKKKPEPKFRLPQDARFEASYDGNKWHAKLTIGEWVKERRDASIHYSLMTLGRIWLKSQKPQTEDQPAFSSPTRPTEIL